MHIHSCEHYSQRAYHHQLGFNPPRPSIYRGQFHMVTLTTSCATGVDIECLQALVDDKFDEDGQVVLTGNSDGMVQIMINGIMKGGE